MIMGTRANVRGDLHTYILFMMLDVIVPFLDYILCGTLVLLGMLYWYQTNTFKFWRNLNVPYLEPNWFFGSVKSEILQRESWNDFAQKIYNNFKGKGFGGVFILKQPVLIVCDPDLIETVLMKDFEIFQDRWNVSFDEPLLQSLFFATGEKWRNMRFKLGQAFSSNKTRNMFSQLLKCADNVLTQVSTNLNHRKALEMEPLAFNFAAEVIASCAFGLEFKAGSDEGKQFRDVINSTFLVTPWKMTSFILKVLHPNIVKWFKIKLFYKEVEIYFLQLCRNAMQYRERNQVQRNDFLQLMLKLKASNQESGEFSLTDGDSFSTNNVKATHLPLSKPNKQHFTENFIASMMFNFFSAGVKPTQVTVSFALFEVARKPDIQKKLREEIHFTLARHNGWTYDAIKDMTYLDQIIQETLRLYTYNLNVVRTVTQPFRIPSTNITLPQGTQVYVPAAAIHMDPRFYPSPDVFDPERFKGNNYKSSSRYMPFGAGPRICVSIRLAVTMMKVYLARLLDKYKVKIGEGTMQCPLVYDKKYFFPQVVGGMWLELEKCDS